MMVYPEPTPNTGTTPAPLEYLVIVHGIDCICMKYSNSPCVVNMVPIQFSVKVSFTIIIPSSFSS